MSLAGLRLSLGLLTVLRVGEVRTDRAAARDAVLAAPLVGLLLGILAWAVGWAVHRVGDAPLLAAVTSVAVLAVATRGLHLDGLADLADGLGSARPAEAALEVMRRSDVGPFGVVTLVLVLLAQVAALAYAWSQDVAGPALLAMAVTGRLLLVLACRRGICAARPDGLGALVAGVVAPVAALALTSLVVIAFAAWGFAVDGPSYGVAVLAGLGCGLLLLRRAVRRLGGITGDVLGATVEAAATGAVVALVLL